MESPKWRPLLKTLRRIWLRALHNANLRYALLGAVTTLILLIFFERHHAATLTSTSRALPDTSTPTLFIAIGSAPKNARLRATARNTWLRWLPSDRTVTYRFFTDAPPTIKHSAATDPSVWRAIRQEATLGDLVMQPLPSGYGTNEHNPYGVRALYQLHWAAEQAPADYFLRIDDDSFLCLHRLLYELKTAPRRQFFWGRFWCREGRNRADENFMLFSHDVASLLANDRLVGGILPFDREVTLGWNFGYWSWVLNLTLFDDQQRIDAQQGYLTKYMHAKTGFEEAGEFCERYIYAHHVTMEAMQAAFEAANSHLMYPLPVRTGPTKTCRQEEQSFVSGRHSSALPALKLTRVEPADG